MDDGGCLGIIIVVAIVAAIVVWILSMLVTVLTYLGTIVLGFLAGAAVVVGFIVAIRNYIIAIKQVRKERAEKGTLKCTPAVRKSIQEMLGKPSKLKAYGQFYEDVAERMYILGPLYSDLMDICRTAFSNNNSFRPDFSRGNSKVTHVAFCIYAVIQAISVYVLGNIFSLLVTIVLLTVMFVLTVLVCPYIFISWVCERAYYKLHKIAYRCLSCKNEFATPYYRCPYCYIIHSKLGPGWYGISKRKCICGTIMPVTTGKEGKLPDGSPIYMEDLTSVCPKCRVESKNTAGTHPISIALIGAQAAGKTTFETAFLRDFVEEEAVKYGMDVDFLSAEVEQWYDQTKKFYEGTWTIEPTKPGQGIGGTDVRATSFVVAHKQLTPGRVIHIYDMPGEIFRNLDAREGLNIFTFHDGAVFILDPYTLERVKEENENDIKNSNMAFSKEKSDVIVESLISTLSNVRAKKESGRFKLPIALTINKVDTPILRKTVGIEAVEGLMKAHSDVFTDYFLTMDYVCRCYLAKHGAKNFIMRLDQNFETVQFFSSSPMGTVPTSNSVRFHPFNVMPIMQWLIRRADKGISSIWKSNKPFINFGERKALYEEFPNYYDEYLKSIGIDN